MRVTGTGFDRAWVRRTLAFTNLRRVRGAQVERLFDGVILVRAPELVEETVRRRAAGQDYPGLQAALRDALAAVARGVGAEVARVAAEAGRRLEGSTYRPRLARRRGERYALARRFTAFVLPVSVEAAAWLAVRLLLDPEPGWGRRLGRCGAPGCGRFNLAFAGRPRRHCSAAHRRRYDQTRAKERVRAWRERQRQQRAAPARG